MDNRTYSAREAASIFYARDGCFGSDGVDSISTCKFCGGVHAEGTYCVKVLLRHAGGGKTTLTPCKLPETPKEFYNYADYAEDCNPNQTSKGIRYLGADGWHARDVKLIDDANESIVVVKNSDDEILVRQNLEISARQVTGEISPFYAKHRIWLASVTLRAEIFNMKLGPKQKEIIDAAVSGHSVVLRFPDEAFASKLASAVVRVCIIPYIPLSLQHLRDTA